MGACSSRSVGIVLVRRFGEARRRRCRSFLVFGGCLDLGFMELS